MLSRDEIFAKAKNEELLTLPSGGQVRVRGLSRNEALKLQDVDTVEERDNYVVATGLVEPAMSLQDVETWAAAPGGAGDLVEVSRAIARLSGMSEGAGESGPTRPGGRRRARV